MSNYAIYRPKGAALEYAEYACNFYVGCSNDCSYCYCKKGLLAHAMGGIDPKLKKCFKNEEHALEVFQKELKANLPELQKHGLFFTFTSDPFLPECIDLTWDAVGHAVYNKVPIKVLTKCTDWVDEWLKDCVDEDPEEKSSYYAFGLTLTGRDDLEPGASTNAERQNAGRKLHNAGFRTFGSFEPIIDLGSTYEQILQALDWCDLFKIGLLSGQKFDAKFKEDLKTFVDNVNYRISMRGSKVYWKDSITKVTGTIDAKCSVDRDFNLFE